MARGEKIGRELLLFDLPEAPATPEVTQSGRNPELIARRNERLLHRFVFYRLENPEWSHAHLVGVLGEEFDLSEVRIGELLAELDDEIRAIRRVWAERRKELKKRWWWLVW